MALNFFKKGNEYNKLAKSINGIYILLNQLKSELKSINIEIDYEEQLSFFAFISRIEILDRIDKYKWPHTTPIVVPSISKKLITLEKALQNSVYEIVVFSEEFDYSHYITAILEKRKEFYDIQSRIPEPLMEMFNI